MFVSNYLRMIHDQLKIINQISWVLEWIFWSIIFERTINFLAHDANEYYKTKIWEVRIIEKTQHIKIWDFSGECSNYYVWSYPPYGKSEKLKNSNQIIWLMSKIFFWMFPFLLEEYNLFVPNHESSLEQ